MRVNRSMWVPVTAAAVMALSGCADAADSADPGKSPSPTTPAALNVRGELHVPLDYALTSQVNPIPTENGPCAVRSGYDDITEGAQVVVTDGAGATVAIGRLGAGQWEGTQGEANSGSTCKFSFVVDGVPAGQKFYGIEVSHRGRLQYTESDLTSGDLNLKLGD